VQVEHNNYLFTGMLFDVELEVLIHAVARNQIGVFGQDVPSSKANKVVFKPKRVGILQGVALRVGQVFERNVNFPTQK
jgi:hypothetical protein